MLQRKNRRSLHLYSFETGQWMNRTKDVDVETKDETDSGNHDSSNESMIQWCHDSKTDSGNHGQMQRKQTMLRSWQTSLWDVAGLKDGGGTKTTRGRHPLEPALPLARTNINKQLALQCLKPYHGSCPPGLTPPPGIPSGDDLTVLTGSMPEKRPPRSMASSWHLAVGLVIFVGFIDLML